jgi:phospholipid transport system transporter-binding protein
VSRATDGTASLALDGPGRARVEGTLGFATVTSLLPLGEQAILAGQAKVIDLLGVTRSDGAGLALLIEWVSIARAASHELTYEHVPAPLLQLARLSDVEPLLLAHQP